MTKEEYYQIEKAKIEKLTLTELKEKYIKLDERASKYFQAWQKNQRA